MWALTGVGAGLAALGVFFMRFELIRGGDARIEVVGAGAALIATGTALADVGLS